MANVNIGQMRTTLQALAPGQLVSIQAGVLLAILNAYNTSAGHEAAIPQVTTGSPKPEISLEGV